MPWIDWDGTHKGRFWVATGGSYSPPIPESDVTNLVADLADKAASTHTHAESDITNLTTDLAAKYSATNRQSSIVNSEISNVDASKITTGTIATARLGSGTANSSTYLRGDQTYATPAGGSGPSYVRITADVSNATINLADVTGLSFSVTSGNFYIFDFFVIFQSDTTTTGIKFAINGPTNNFFTLQKTVPTSLTVSVNHMERVVNTVATATTGVDTANANLQARLYGVINPTANGTIIVRFAAETTGTVKVMSGSMGILYTVP